MGKIRIPVMDFGTNAFTSRSKATTGHKNRNLPHRHPGVPNHQGGAPVRKTVPQKKSAGIFLGEGVIGILYDICHVFLWFSRKIFTNISNLM
jgi:hypothetical protein